MNFWYVVELMPTNMKWTIFLRFFSTLLPFFPPKVVDYRDLLILFTIFNVRSESLFEIDLVDFVREKIWIQKINHDANTQSQRFLKLSEAS